MGFRVQGSGYGVWGLGLEGLGFELLVVNGFGGVFQKVVLGRIHQDSVGFLGVLSGFSSFVFRLFSRV